MSSRSSISSLSSSPTPTSLRLDYLIHLDAEVVSRRSLARLFLVLLLLLLLFFLARIRMRLFVFVLRNFFVFLPPFSMALSISRNDHVVLILHSTKDRGHLPVPRVRRVLAPLRHTRDLGHYGALRARERAQVVLRRRRKFYTLSASPSCLSLPPRHVYVDRVQVHLGPSLLARRRSFFIFLLLFRARQAVEVYGHLRVFALRFL